MTMALPVERSVWVISTTQSLPQPWTLFDKSWRMPTSRKRSEPRAQYCPCSRENIDLTQEHPLPKRKHHRGVRHRSGTDGAGV